MKNEETPEMKVVGIWPIQHTYLVKVTIQIEVGQQEHVGDYTLSFVVVQNQDEVSASDAYKSFGKVVDPLLEEIWRKSAEPPAFSKSRKEKPDE